MAEAKKTKKSSSTKINIPATVSWESEEFAVYKKNVNWYFTYGLLGIVVAGIFVFMQQYYSAGVIVLLMIALFSQSKAKPGKNNYRIDENGLVINDQKRYLFSEMSKFWIVSAPEGVTIYIQLTKKFSFPIVLFLGTQDFRAIIAILSSHIPYDSNQGEPITDRFTRMFKF